MTFIWYIYIQVHFDVKETEEKTKYENNTNNKDMNENLNLSDFVKLSWYQMKGINTLTINEVFVNW